MEFLFSEKIIMLVVTVLTIICVAVSLKRKPEKLEDGTDDFIQLKNWETRKDGMK